MNLTVSPFNHQRYLMKRNIEQKTSTKPSFAGNNDDKEIERNSHTKPHKKMVKHPVKLTLGAALAAMAISTYNANKPEPINMTRQQITQNAIDIQLDLDFQKADLIYDINNILEGKEIPEHSLNLYNSTIKSDDEKIYMSENAGQMMDVLAIAASSDSAKDQVSATDLKPYLERALMYNNGGLFDYSGDAVTGAGEPWHYIAAAILTNEYPELAETMPEEERKKLQERGFLENLWNDVKITAGKGEQNKQYLGDILENRDRDYSLGILTADNNWPYEPYNNEWFGPVAVGYAIRGGLENVSDMSIEEIDNFRIDYINNKSNHKKFAEDKDYAQKVISSYIVKYMNDSVNDNSGKLNSGMAALALEQAGLMDKRTIETLHKQVEKEAPEYHLFTNETQKLDAAIKAYVLEQEGEYGNLSAETRKEIREFQAKNRASTATSIFMLAEESYYRDYIDPAIENQEECQNSVSEAVNDEDKEEHTQSLTLKLNQLKDCNTNIQEMIDKELEVAKLTDDDTSTENLQNISNNLSKQNEQIEKNLNNIKEYESKTKELNE